MTPEAPAPRGRPRDPEADRAILAAAADLLGTSGFGGLTMEAVAERAGVSKATVYRRHPCRQDLLHAVCQQFAPPVGGLPDTGDTRRDLAEVLERLAASLSDSEPGRVVPALLAASAVEPEARAAIARFAAGRRSVVREVVERGVARGDLPEGTSHEVLADLLVGAVLYRTLVRGEPVGPALVEAYLGAALPTIS